MNDRAAKAILCGKSRIGMLPAVISGQSCEGLNIGVCKGLAQRGVLTYAQYPFRLFGRRCVFFLQLCCKFRKLGRCTELDKTFSCNAFWRSTGRHTAAD